MIELEENMDPNAIIKANTVKLHTQSDPTPKQTKKPHAPPPLVSEPVDHDHYPKHTGAPPNNQLEKQKSGSSLNRQNHPSSDQLNNNNSRLHTEDGESVLINELEREQRIL
jgi:hypothetical protein